jgi:hypothetical protein
MFLVLWGLELIVGFVTSVWLGLYWMVLLGPILLVTILIHELGHCLAARFVGSEAHEILLWPLGGLAFIGHTAGPKGALPS